MNIKLPIIDYINEFKIRFIYIIILILFLITISYDYFEELLYIMSKPVDKIYNNQFIYTSITEVLNIKILLSIYIAIYIGIISLIYNIIIFLYSGLYKFEIKKIKFYFIIGLIVIFLSNYVTLDHIIPFIYKYLLTSSITNKNKLFNLTLIAKINEFCINYIVVLTIVTIFFLLPFSFIFIYKIKIINNEFINKNRDFIYILLILIISFVTPPDFMSFLILFFFFIVFYEFFIYFFFLFNIYKYFIFFKKNN
uniref:SecY-independent transporter protein n=1 Tax=Malawimonas jakobiformis TaxID=136089 RepID=Q9G862_MALJA|nr:SecY-independent transporter protein [Malawimonas jakobiformis]AAG13715.1 SecY-independent transporter protein [Malawimonas jakobiformis]